MDRELTKRRHIRSIKKGDPFVAPASLSVMTPTTRPSASATKVSPPAMRLLVTALILVGGEIPHPCSREGCVRQVDQFCDGVEVVVRPNLPSLDPGSGRSTARPCPMGCVIEAQTIGGLCIRTAVIVVAIVFLVRGHHIREFLRRLRGPHRAGDRNAIHQIDALPLNERP
jgi:hypothetical protein